MNVSVLTSVQRITTDGKCIQDPSWSNPFGMKTMQYDPTGDSRRNLHGRMVKSELISKGWTVFHIEKEKSTGKPSWIELISHVSGRSESNILCPPGKTPVLKAGEKAKAIETTLPLFRPTEFGSIYQQPCPKKVFYPPTAPISTVKMNQVPVPRGTGGYRRDTDWTSTVEQALINSQCVLDPAWKGPGMHTMQFTATDSKNLNARKLLDNAGWKTHHLDGEPWMCPPGLIPFFETITQTPDEAGPATADEVVVVGPDTIVPATLLEEEETVSEEEVKKAIKKKDEEEANYLPYYIAGGVGLLAVVGTIAWVTRK
jgi:hypothetical protein